MRDRFGREIRYLRVSLTERCNLHCSYCRPTGSEKAPSERKSLSLKDLLQVCGAAYGLGIDRFRLTGGEPLLRNGCPRFVASLKDLCPGAQVGLTTNGLLFSSRADALRSAGLDRVNFSLDSLRPDSFRRMTGSSRHGRVLEGIRIALLLGFPRVKINVVLIRGLNDGEVCGFVDRFWGDPVSIRFIEYMPYGFNGWEPSRVYPYESILEDLSRRYELEPSGSEGSGPSRDFVIKGARCRVGLISPLTRSFCVDCNRLRLTSEGLIRPCLFSEEAVDLRPLLRARAPLPALQKALGRAVGLKPQEHRMSGVPSVAPRLAGAMSDVGG
jgi:cyclic pyranopterin phosphate synthase